MQNSKITLQVTRKKKAGTGLLKGIMIVFGVLFILMGILLSRGFMLSGFLLIGLYFVFDTFSKKEYEYTLEGLCFTVSVIWGKRYRPGILLIDFQIPVRYRRTGECHPCESGNSGNRL